MNGKIQAKLEKQRSERIKFFAETLKICGALNSGPTRNLNSNFQPTSEHLILNSEKLIIIHLFIDCDSSTRNDSVTSRQCHVR